MCECVVYTPGKINSIKYFARTGRMGPSNGLIIFLCLVTLIHGQLTMYGCPKGWELNEKICYKFVSDKPRIWEEADAACWLYGATLLSISSVQEHQFISKWLTANDALRPSLWFTSGYYSNGVVVWNGDNVLNNQGQEFWLSPPTDNSIYSLVAYALPAGRVQVNGFGWKLVSPSAPSNYICEIPQSRAVNIGKQTRDFGYGKADVNINALPRGPEMRIEPRSVVVFTQIQSVYLECAAVSNPNPTFHWYKGNNTITSQTSPRYTLSGGRLTIQNPEEEADSGYYWCQAENEFGNIRSNEAQILFGYLHYFSPVQPTDFWGTAFEGTRVSCDAPSANPGVTYAWYKFRTNNWVWPGHPIHFVSQSGYLYFSEVQPTDGRKYFCVVTLSAPAEFMVASNQPPSRTSLGRYLRIKGGKTTGNYGPIIYTHAFPSPAMRGRTIRLECIAYGSSPLTYTWRREDGRSFEKGTKITARNRVLTITNAQLTAQGNYICKCSRPGAHDTKVISLVMETKPYFPFPMKNMLVDDGQRIQWRCKAVARPAATYAWFKNGKPVTTIPGEVEVRGTYLTINSVVASRDEGMYQCAATNEHGTTYTSGQLKVLSFSPTFSRYPLPQTTLAPLGGNVTIPCQAEGAPEPTVVWIKGSSNMNLLPGNTDGRVGMTVRNDLVIQGITRGDQGFYTCKATNAKGEASSSTELQLVDGVVITQAPVPTEALVNTTAFLYCQASFDNSRFDLTYIWRFNGHPIDYTLSRHHIKGTQHGLQGLYIVMTQYTHQGKYECEAKTAFQSETRSAQLTVRGPPGPPAGVYIDDASVTSYSVRVIWTVGVETGHNDPIIFYDIEGETHFKPGDWHTIARDIPEVLAVNNGLELGLRPDQRAVVVQNLIPNSGYRFRVRAANSLGRGKEASMPSDIVKIPKTAPVTAPRNVSGGDGKVGTLTITWQKFDISEHCGPGFGYKVYWKKLGSPATDWSKAVVGDVDQHVALVGKTNYYLEYEVKVGSFNEDGDGPNSTIEVIFSAEGIPVAVPTILNAVSVNCTAVTLYWEPVPDNRENMKGRVKGYTIQVYTNTLGISPFKGFEPPRIMNREIYGQTNNATVIGLDKNSEFFFRMQVFNSAARGPKGEWRRGETYMTSPLLWPRNVEVHPHTRHSIKVHWQGISTSQYEESVLGYKIRVWKVQDDFRTGNDTTVGKVSEAILGNLQTETVYVMRVRGYSRGGNGVQSNPVFFTVLGGQVPFDPTTSQICYEGSTCSHARSLQSVSTILIAVIVSIATFLLF